MDGRLLDYVALVILIFVLLTIIYAILFIHDIPYEIAKKRKHPHQDTIHTAGWVSLFLMHTIWPFLWIWATLYKPDRESYMDVVVEENKKAYDLTLQQFDVGKIDFLDVLVVQNKWLVARIARLDLSMQRLINRVDLHLALGGSFSE